VNDRTRDLVSGYLDGLLTEADEAELNFWIKASPENAVAFAEMVRLHDRLHDQLSPSQPKEPPLSNSNETPRQGLLEFAIEFADVVLEYPQTRPKAPLRVLDKVTARIRKGSIVALLGEAGSGKTTLMRLVNRLGKPTSGKVLVRGKPVHECRDVEQLRRGIGYVIQESGLFPHMTVFDNVATVPRLLRWSRDEVRRRVTEVLDRVQLPEKDFGGRFPHQLSGGQRQRAGVARGLAGRPDILLMDEPFGALDPATRARVQDEFLRIHAETKMTVVMVTHDMAEAGKMADEIILLGGANSPWRGQVLQQGPLRDILLRPSDKVKKGSALGGGAGGIAREALLLRCVLPLLQDEGPPFRHGGESIHQEDTLALPETTPLGEAMVALEGALPGQVVRVDGASGTGRWYYAHALRRQIVADLRQAEAAFSSPTSPAN
jgi:osmoprotectant transport system ATP-binding protein